MKFIEEGHLYLDDNEKRYTSVTTLIKSLEKAKDWNKIAKNYIAKHELDMTVEELRKEWKNKGIEACDRGTRYHSIKENELNEAGEVVRDGTLCKVKFTVPFEGAISQHDCKLENNTIYTEMMVWDEEAVVCGKVDEIKVINNTLYIDDHKTSKEIKKQGFYIKNVGFTKLLAPIAHLDDCNWNHYSLQLSLYMYILWKKNKHLRIGKLIINHVQMREDGKVKKVVPMEVPYLRKEAIAILDMWKTKNQ